MRAVVIACLLASTLSSVATTGANAQETYCSVNTTGVTTCVNAYVASATNGGNICQALDTYISCLGTLFSCNSYYASTWNASLSAYRSVWDSFCTIIPSISGTADTSMVFGDPHYRLTNGTYQTCNDLGVNVLAVSNNFIVKVMHSSAGASGGAIVTSVTAELYHVGAPAGSFTWTLNDSPATVSKGGVTVSASGIEASALGLILTITRKSDHLIVGAVTKKLTGGILLKGCANPAATPSTVGINGSCASVPAAFQAACLYDSSRMGSTWAASSANSASTQQTSLEATARRENSAPSTASAFVSALLIAVCAMGAMAL
jgi:hypothetical protein